MVQRYYLRTAKMYDAYDAHKAAHDGYADGCPLCKEPTITEYIHWRLVSNRFPYDLITDMHDMLVLKEHVGFDNISDAAWEELKDIKKENHKTYDAFLENFPKNQTVPAHAHFHLIRWKPLS